MFNYTESSKYDIDGMCKPWLDTGQAKKRADGVIEVAVTKLHNSPWYHVNQLNGGCSTWQQIIFPFVGYVPMRCMSCWKVVVRPRTLVELFALAEIQEGCQYKCKCGCEPRVFVHGNYGGYFYFTSKEDGLDGLDHISRIVKDKISPNVKVILKRGCTEFEGSFPHSATWQPLKGQKELEKYILDRVVLAAQTFDQTPEEVLHVKRGWVEFAYDRGDPTAIDFNGGKPLYTPPDTYERGN